MYDADKPKHSLSAAIELIDLQSGDTVIKTNADEKTRRIFAYLTRRSQLYV
ncbi:MAG: hypothetical protein IPL33_16550 [Sphingobacteriales bacterium]|nr:hypothetical protein [Sphingobacteriales bacterium]